MNQSRLMALTLTLLMLLLVLLAAFIFTFQAQNTLENRVTSLSTENLNLQLAGTRTGGDLTDARATRDASFNLRATAEATNLRLEEELVGSTQDIDALAAERDALQTELDNLRANLETANNTILQYEERFLAQPPRVTVAAPVDGASFAAGEPILFIVAAGDTIGVNRIDFSLNGNTVSYPASNERLLTRLITQTLAAPGLYTATITVLNVSQLTSSITTTVRILSEEAAQQANVAATLATLRQRSPAVPEPLFLISRAEFDAWLEATLPTAESAQQQTAVLQAFGLLPPGTDLTRWRAEALAAPFAGFYYDPASGQVLGLTAADISGDLVEWTLLQELVPTSPLSATFASDAPGVTDAALARQALLLGEAVLNQSLFLYRDEEAVILTDAYLDTLNGSGAPLIGEMPEALRSQWLFPYETGFAYVANIYRAGGFAALSAAQSAPPRTTWEILTQGMQQPQQVTLPDLQPALGAGWTQVASDTWGAFRLRQYLAQHAAETLVEPVAAVWHGDQYAVYDNPDGELILVYRLAWQTPEDQSLFTAAYTDFASARYGAEGTAAGSDGRCWQGEETACLFLRETEAPGTESLVILAPDEETAVTLAALIAP